MLREFCTSKSIMSELTFPPVTVVDVSHTLIHLKLTDTRDLEGLDSKILKLSAPVIVDTLTYISNLCIHKSCFPRVLKIDKVIPIHKHGARTDTSNYRPISVLSLLSKPLEKHIHKHILKHLNDNRLLHPNQSGFRENNLSDRLKKVTSLHPGKTTWMLVTSRQKRQNLTVSLPAICMQNQAIEQSTTHKVLGVIIDNNLCWSPHKTYVCKVISFKVFQFSKIKHFLNFHARKLVSMPTFRHALTMDQHCGTWLVSQPLSPLSAFIDVHSNFF